MHLELAASHLSHPVLCPLHRSFISVSKNDSHILGLIRSEI